MKILVIEDDANITHLIRLYLEQASYTVLTAGDGIEGLELHAREQPDLVILDLMLPALDGMEVCRRIRAWASTPILMLKAILRRSTANTNAATSEMQPGRRNEEEIRYGGLVINKPARRVIVNGQQISLTVKEFDLLVTLASAPDRVFTREALLNQVWGYTFIGDGRTVDVHIGTLRKKLEAVGDAPHYIQTVWGVGYKFVPAPSTSSTRS
jgi:DNA-binding response OmpR family regulator